MIGVIWYYQLSWWCKLATVKSFKADVSSVSSSSALYLSIGTLNPHGTTSAFHLTNLFLEKDVFRLVTSVGQRKNSESPWRIKPQTFRFRAQMLYHWATATPRWAKSIARFIWHASCILLGSAMSMASCLSCSWQDEKHLSLFLYRAQNLPSLLFYS